MLRFLSQSVFVVLTALTLHTVLLDEAGAKPSDSHSPLILITNWWEIPFQPPEKWFSPKWEDDEWYKQRQQKKYRKRG